MCRFSSEKSKTQYKRLRNQTSKVVARAMRKEAEQELHNSCQNANRVFRFLKIMKKNRKVLKWKKRRAGFY